MQQALRKLQKLCWHRVFANKQETTYKYSKSSGSAVHRGCAVLRR